MKRQRIFALLVLIIGFTQACIPDEKPIPKFENQDLLKVWEISKVLENTLDITDEFSQYTIRFIDDGIDKTFILSNQQGTQVGSWTISTDKNTITLTVNNGPTITLYEVSFNANKLKYKSDETGKAGPVTIDFILVPV